MPLTIVANQGTAPAPQSVAPQTVVQRAQEVGNSNAAQALAITIPIIRTDQTGLSYRQRRGPTGLEFQFDTGTLTLTLRQEMLVANDLSDCARQKWIVHENGHVSDYQTVMTRMEAEIRASPRLQPILISPQWRPRAQFSAIQQTIQNEVGAIFQRLTRQAAAARDTPAEYARVQRDISQNCP